ncbi:hypothetical protein KUCAC02_026061 [Chaenocephalus aceratus]|uniref:Uncharacterized protein n=1 Tax=Chaenocephalus aceratus TaxID=36190 RepID=A0ACB9VWV6_CHAAC|nr:hypothetical protein KUCAC02_026061 [Chaenocephalus aceratus]
MHGEEQNERREGGGGKREETFDKIRRCIIVFDRREEDSRRLRLRHPDTDRQTEQVTSAQTDSVAKPTAKEVQNNKMQEMINLVHSKTNC